MFNYGIRQRKQYQIFLLTSSRPQDMLQIVNNIQDILLEKQTIIVQQTDASWKSLKIIQVSGGPCIERKAFIASINTLHYLYRALFLKLKLLLCQLKGVHIIFVGDCRLIYEALDKCISNRSNILVILFPMIFSFKYIPRSHLSSVDYLAKSARLRNQNYVISWFM